MKKLNFLYHDVIEDLKPWETSGFISPDANLYKFKTSGFRSHLQQIVGALQSAPGWEPGHDWCLTFDDGGESFHSVIAPLLEEYGFRGLFFITTKWIDSQGFLNQAQIFDLVKRGHKIGSHSHTHPENITLLAEGDILQEWELSRSILEKIIGEPVQVASIPAGNYSSKVARAALKAGFMQLYTSEPILKPWRVFEQGQEIELLGRISVMRTMESLEPILEDRFFWFFRERVIWETKKLIKKTAWPFYSWIRKIILRRRES